MKWSNGKYAGSVPKALTSEVRGFTAQHGDDLQYVEVKPLPFAEQRQCYGNCDIARQIFGGTMVLGYSIWNTKNLFLSSEHHCVWRKPDGTLVDLTPDISGESRVLFVPHIELGQDDDVQSIVENIVFNGDNGRFCVLVKSPLIERAVDTLNRAAARLHQRSNEAISRGQTVSDSEVIQFDRAMNAVDHYIDNFYASIRQKEENKKRRQKRKRKKAARARKR
jgi:hypothetical protein